MSPTYNCPLLLTTIHLSKQFMHHFLLMCVCVLDNTQTRMPPLPVYHPNHLYWPPPPNFPTSAHCVGPSLPHCAANLTGTASAGWAAFQKPF